MSKDPTSRAIDLAARSCRLSARRQRDGRRAVQRWPHPLALRLPQRPGPLGVAGAKSIEEMIMSKVVVLYYSSYGHIGAMANAVAEGRGRPVRMPPSSADPSSYPRRSRANHTTNSIRWRRSRRSKISLPTMRSSSVPAPALGDSRRRWPISSTRPEAFTCAVHCTARSAARLPRAPRNMAGRRRRCSRSSPISCTSAWWLWDSITAMPDK
jgi:hypothetical protein